MSKEQKFRYFLKLGYNGANYHGWQIQPNAPSVQETLNGCLQKIFQQEINVVGCGRTDTGVHARMFFAHFDLDRLVKPEKAQVYIRKMNGILPADISIEDFFRVNSEAHARFDALSRTYQYRILRKKDPFLIETSYPYYYGDLDLDLMNEGARMLMEYEDFTSFSKLHTDVKTNLCKIQVAYWEYSDPLFNFTITADRFLRNMVRAIVGTLIDLGRGKIDEKELRRIVESKNRSEAGYSVPAKGLFLMEVVYPENIKKIE